MDISTMKLFWHSRLYAEVNTVYHIKAPSMK